MRKKLVIAALMTLLLTLVVGSAMAADCTNHNWTEWTVKDGVTHSRHCQNEGCYATEYEDHYGGKATCCSKALCEVCGRAYGKATGVHEWEVSSYTADQHTLTCYGCQRQQTASHNWTEWAVKDGVTHSRTCQDEGCYATEYEDHYGGKATCCSKPLCEVCGRAYGKATGVHEWQVTSTNDRQHTLTCPGCQRVQTEYHSGGTATCVEKRKCETCGQSYGTTNEQHAWDYNNAVVVEEATCKRGKTTEYSCYLCGTTSRSTELKTLDCVAEARVGKAATCTEDGYYVMVCKTCGEEKGLGDTIPALGHDLVKTVTQEATCCVREQGKYQCSRCDFYRPYDTMGFNPDNHTGLGDLKTVESTCCKKGYTYRFCSDCKTEVIESYLDTVDHAYFYAEYEGSCDASGHNLHCNYGCCVYWEGNPYKTEAHYGGTATCGTGALCAVCGYEYTEPLGNHTMGAWYHKNETHDMRECSKCDYYETTPHNYGKTISLDAEKHSKKCSICGMTVTGEHTLVETITQKANCDQGTVTTITCTGCDYTQTRIADDKQKHAYKTFTVKEPTCTAEGLIRTGCVNCGKILSEEATDPLGHTLLNDQVVANSNCCTPGILREYCTQKGCDYYEDTEIPVKPTMHDFGDWTYADDDSHTRTCKNGCGTVETAAHSTKNIVCYEQQVCDVCGSAYGERVRHDYVYKKVSNEYCTEVSMLTFECRNCQHVRTEMNSEAAHELVWLPFEADNSLAYLDRHHLICTTHNDSAPTIGFHNGGTPDENGAAICADCGAKYYVNEKGEIKTGYYDFAKDTLPIIHADSRKKVGTAVDDGCSSMLFGGYNGLFVAADGNIYHIYTGEVIGTTRDGMLFDNDGDLFGLVFDDMILITPPDYSGDWHDWDWTEDLERFYALHPELAPAE